MSVRSSLLALAATVLVSGPATAAEEIWAATANKNLINFISSNPWSFSSRPITGMQAGETARRSGRARHRLRSRTRYRGRPPPALERDLT